MLHCFWKKYILSWVDGREVITITFKEPKEGRMAAKNIHWSAPVTIHHYYQSQNICTLCLLSRFSDLLGRTPPDMYVRERPGNTRSPLTHVFRSVGREMLNVPTDPLPEGTFLSKGPLSSERISTLIKNVLSSAGIDTTIWKASACRGAASSHAYRNAMSISRILQQVGGHRKGFFEVTTFD